MTVCNFCGEHEGVAFIPDPNFEDHPTPDWWVCAECKETIPKMQLEALKILLDATVKEARSSVSLDRDQTHDMGGSE